VVGDHCASSEHKTRDCRYRDMAKPPRTIPSIQYIGTDVQLNMHMTFNPVSIKFAYSVDSAIDPVENPRPRILGLPSVVVVMLQRSCTLDKQPGRTSSS